MKVVGILVLALVCGLVAAGVSLGSGGSLWAAFVNYFAFGMLATLFGFALVIWRAWEGERPTGKLVLGGAASASK